MFNVLTDDLPREWNRYRINAGFEIGIKISQLLKDPELTIAEKAGVAIHLLYIDIPGSTEEAMSGIQWFLNGWNHDNHSGSKDSVEVFDFDVDQWRIYAAFRSQYNINLNTARLHWFEFMGLLTNLSECTFSQVVEFRGKKLTSKMSAVEKKAIMDAKKLYKIHKAEEALSEEEQLKNDLALEEFNKLRKSQH